MGAPRASAAGAGAEVGAGAFTFDFAAGGVDAAGVRRAYREHGFVVLRGFADGTEVAALRARAEEIAAEAAESGDGAVALGGRDRQTSSERRFLDSAAGVEAFWEKGGAAVNKLGHAMHDLDGTFRSFSRSDNMRAVLRDLIGYTAPTPVQSMYIFKRAGVGGEVIPHIDSTFLHTEPPSACGMWVAMEPATTENGCLWAKSGSHRAAGAGAGGGGGEEDPASLITGPVARRFRLQADGLTTAFDAEDEEEDCRGGETDTAGYVPLEVGLGDLVVLHGSVRHFSFENRSEKSRHAYTVHFVEAEQEGGAYRWSADNWLQRGDAMPFEPL